MEENRQLVEYKAGDQQITLTMDDVKEYLVSGDTEVSDKEIVQFMMLCKAQGLNPWVKECYLIKYGKKAATLVIGKEAYMKRAERNPLYDGMDSGVIVKRYEAAEEPDYNENGEPILDSNGNPVMKRVKKYVGIEYRNGIFYDKAWEKIVGGWADVFRKDRGHSSRAEVEFEEYAGYKTNYQTGKQELNGQWATRPATMIRKVAQVQALREAFPSDLGGLYLAEEQGMVEDDVFDAKKRDIYVESEVHDHSDDPFKKTADKAENPQREVQVDGESV